VLFRSKAGERRKVGVPGTASAVFDVSGEAYTGLQMALDGRQVAGPYPAQIKSIAAGAHTVRYRWVTGPLAGTDITQTITVGAGGHFRIRAVPDHAQVVVQQLR
jgi:hypothetical protein